MPDYLDGCLWDLNRLKSLLQIIQNHKLKKAENPKANNLFENGT